MELRCQVTSILNRNHVLISSIFRDSRAVRNNITNIIIITVFLTTLKINWTRIS